VDQSVDFTVENLYRGADWIYSYNDLVLAFDFTVVYFWLLGIVFGDVSEAFFKYFWFLTFNYTSTQLLWATILDKYIVTVLSNLFYDDFWFKAFMSSKDSLLILCNHPEIIFIQDGLKNYILNPYSTEFFYSLISNDLMESYITPIVLLPQFVLSIYLVGLFSIFLFGFFSQSTTEENLIDHDFLINSLLVESEEEIGSLDDILIGGILFFFIFGWYFYFNAFFLLTWIPETMLVTYLFPGIYYIIICIPTFLLYDFGVFFLSYLNGVGSSSVILFSLVFDYIAFLAFYIRLTVQGVRLILMIFVYVSLYDFIVFHPVNGKLFLGGESLLGDISNFSLTHETFSYFFFSKLPKMIIKWVYELAHTFFVVTAQFIAFFAMVFWLFFFLYTFFVLEKFEDYFSEKRKIRINRLNTVYSFKG
jgi:hypothetical protein